MLGQCRLHWKLLAMGPVPPSMDQRVLLERSNRCSCSLGAIWISWRSRSISAIAWSMRYLASLARALVDEGVTRLTERASFLELQPAPGAMRFARRPAQISHAAFEHEAMGEFHGKSRNVM